MAQSSIRVNGARHAFAFEAITVSNASIGVTAATAFPRLVTGSNGMNSLDHGAEEAFFTVETDQVRYTLDGTVPTAAIGHRLNPDDTLWLVGRDMIRKVRFIRVTTDAALKATYFRD